MYLYPQKTQGLYNWSQESESIEIIKKKQIIFQYSLNIYGATYHANCFICIFSFIPYNKTPKSVFFYRQGNWVMGQEKTCPDPHAEPQFYPGPSASNDYSLTIT